jgi:hypothetical protein
MKPGLQIGIKVTKEYPGTQKGYERVRRFSIGYQKGIKWQKQGQFFRWLLVLLCSFLFERGIWRHFEI